MFVNLEEKEYLALLDTGSSVSIIKKSALPDGSILHKTNKNLADLSNNLNVLGCTMLYTKIDTVEVPILFYVLDNWRLNVDVILGMNLLNKVNGVIDLHNKTFMACHSRIKTCVPLLDSSFGGSSYTVHCIENMKVEGESQNLIMTKA